MQKHIQFYQIVRFSAAFGYFVSHPLLPSHLLIYLCTEKLRTIYDQHGYKGLINGVDDAPGWSFTVSPMSVYAQFFGDTKPITSLPSASHTSTQSKADPLVINVYASLEELSQGAVRQVKIIRQVIVNNEPQALEKTIKLTIQPGWREDTKLTFPKGGDEEKDMDTGDLVLVIKEKPHPRFRRDKNDLVFTASISLLQALSGTVVEVPMLDGRVLSVPVNDIVKPGYTMMVPSEGMPISKDNKTKGNLIIDFNVKYPTALTIKQKEQLAMVLPQ